MPTPLVLAPLAGVSDLPFRLMARRHGCPLAFIEMTSAKGLTFKNPKTLEIISSCAEDQPLGMQLVGNDETFLLRALDMLQDRSYACIDLNAACPVRKVVSHGEGSALMQDPPRLAALLRAMVRYAAPVPVTVKIRSGWDHASRNARDVAVQCEQAGVSAIFIHGRTRSQMYSGTVDYESIREVKQAVSIPVIGSGDVFGWQGVMRMREATGVDGVAVARGAFGNPWIFTQAAAALAGQPVPPEPTPQERIAVMREHMALCLTKYGAERGVRIFRKFFIWYTKGLAGARLIRPRAMLATDPHELEAAMMELAGVCE